MNFRKRIEELERKLQGDKQIRILMEDGSERTIRLRPGEDILDWCGRVMSNPDGEEADLIRRSVSWSEPNGSRMLELANAVLCSPIEAEKGDFRCDWIIRSAPCGSRICAHPRRVLMNSQCYSGGGRLRQINFHEMVSWDSEARRFRSRQRARSTPNAGARMTPHQRISSRNWRRTIPGMPTTRIAPTVFRRSQERYPSSHAGWRRGQNAGQRHSGATSKPTIREMRVWTEKYLTAQRPAELALAVAKFREEHSDFTSHSDSIAFQLGVPARCRCSANETANYTGARRFGAMAMGAAMNSIQRLLDLPPSPVTAGLIQRYFSVEQEQPVLRTPRSNADRRTGNAS